MKYRIFWASVTLGVILAMLSSAEVKNETRDLEYEAYVDSVWANDPNEFYDVIVESDEYQLYIEQNGEW